MLSNEHEALAELFQHNPPLAAELAAMLGVDIPEFASAELKRGDYSDVMPTEWRSDGVVALRTTAGKPAMAIVVEVQRSDDGDKRWAWPVYLSTTRARLKCPVTLLVVCPDPKLAAWCATPIDTGHPGFVLRPLVLTPDQVPVITDPQQARRLLELAVLPAIVHSDHTDIEQIIDALLAGLKTMTDGDHALLYSVVVLHSLPDEPQHYMEDQMTITADEFKSNFFRRLAAESKAEGKAEALLTLFHARGIDMPVDARERITNCTDADQLDEWLRRAAVGTSVNELFDE